jgi:glutathione S-transferase
VSHPGSGAEYTLYWGPGTCARVTYVALVEIGAPYEVVVVDRTSRHSATFLEVNPKGKVPVLVHNGRTYTENPAIQTFLARRHPEAGLLPLGDGDREQESLEWMSWFAAGVHPPITRLRFPGLLTDHAAAWPSLRAGARAQLEDAFSVIERRLQDREWLMGDWTILDVYLLWLWFRATGSGMEASAFPGCAGHARRCEQRPSVAFVLDREEEAFTALEAMSEPGFYPPYQAGRAPTFPLPAV